MGKALTAAMRTLDRVERRTLRAVGYLRVSTEEQVKGYGLSSGYDAVTEHSEEKGWEYVDTFRDEGVSGSLPWQERDDLPRLMELARQEPRPFDVVIVPETRAIGRRDRVFWRWVWELQDLGVFVAVVDKDIDNTTEDGEAAMREEANYAFKEYTRIRTRTQKGIQKKAKTGGWTGGVPPFGWYIKNQGKKGESTPAVDETEASCARRARYLRVRRKTRSEIAAVLNAEQHATRSGAPWNERSVGWMLKSRALLTNEVVFRSERNAKLDENGQPVYGPSVAIKLPQIFSKEEIAELELAEKFLAGTQAPQRDAAFYPLSGRLLSPCGGKYTGYRRKDRGVRLYRCTGRPCLCSQIDADALEARLWGQVCRILGDAEQLGAMAKDWSVLAAKNRVNFAARLAELDEQINEQSETIDVTAAVAARRAVKRGMSRQQAEEAAEKAVKPLEQELARLEKERAQVAEWQAESQASEQQLHDLKKLAEVARTNLHALAPEEQAEVLALLGMELQVTGPVPKAPPAGSPGAWFLERKWPVPELTDEEWSRVEPVLRSLDTGRGPNPMPARQVLAAVLLKARTGIRWEDIPKEYGKAASIRQRWNRWKRSGAWEQIMEPLRGAPGQLPPLLPPIEMRGRLDPRALIGHMAAPDGNGPVEPLWGPRGFDMASLDHAMWFHRPFRTDEWFLYDQESPIATGGRGLARGRIYDREGRLLVSVVQEGLFRRR